ncbi:MAG: hypothetical protein JXM68_14200, partial [Sedimentisphaerales bacterium]|nr:hypothetical protein [Sedimentisphaerales bacterium]
MNYPDDQQGKMNVIDLSTFYFVRLFRGFSLSVQPGKILLAIIIVLALYGAGWLLDFLAGGSHSVVSDDIYDFNKSSEIAWYAGNLSKADDSITDVKEFRRVTVENHTEKLIDVMSLPVMKDSAGENSLELIRSGAVKSLLQDKYCILYEKCMQALPVRYKITHANMIEGFNRSKQASKEDKMEFNFQQRQLLDDIDKAYTQIGYAMIDGRVDGDIDLLLGKVITVDVKLTGKEYSDDLLYYAGLKKEVADVITLAQAMKTAQAIEGRGVFSAIADFKLTRLHNLAVSLVLLDFEQVKDIIYELAFGSVWMFRYHPYYVLILYLVAFGIYAIFGGAICRISALQVTRQEHVGTIESLHFSFRHFRQLFLVPVMPILVVAGCGLIILVSSWLSLIPYIGPLFMTLSLVVIFGLGFLMAIVTIGLVVGHGLMYPAVAVDDADAFDAMSRAFTYIIRKPWHLAAYAFIAAIYGIICYVFLRSFLLILFACVRESFASGWDIDVVWPVPSF